MSGSVLYVLLFCVTLPNLYRAQNPQHGHHSRLDTNPDELRPVRQHRRTTTQRSITVKDEFRLPEPPYQPPMTNRMSLTSDPEYDYDAYDSYSYDARVLDFMTPSANPTAYVGSGAIHEHDHDTDSSTHDVVADYKEYTDPLDGHKDHLKNESAGTGSTWKTMVLSLFLIKMVALF